MATNKNFSLNDIRERFNSHDIEINTTVKMEVEICVFHDANGELCVNFNVPHSDESFESEKYLEYLFSLSVADGTRAISFDDIAPALEISATAKI